jgi:surface antigen
VDRTPAVGGILVTNESWYGHVAYIESVEGDTFTISEWNYAGRYIKTIRTFSVNDRRIVGIIHVE